jgi:N-acylglucosamine 2-epimerase (GlcNAc 2-epimerase)
MDNKNNFQAENRLSSALQKLLTYCRQNDWAGFDPYDALNSRILKAFPVLDSRIPRIVMTQALKLSPVNVRGLLGIPKTQNSKALAVFLSSFLNLSAEQVSDRESLIGDMIRLIATKRSPGASYWCWGYSFPWQTRNEVVPTEAPNLVCTTFVALALLDAYDQVGDPKCLEMAVSAAEYIVKDLYWTEGSEVAGFSYPQPGVRSRTHNANLLAAALLCRVSKHTGEAKFLGPALTVARYSVSKQRDDGSWDYGEAASQRWIDNFHTGYNLRALQSICRYADTTEFDSCTRRGYEFYRTHFFREDGAARYFHDRTYPIDIHSVAESIITLLAFRELDPNNVALAQSVFEWAMNHLWDDRGFFYYRKLRLGTIRTSYMRWSQAWMLLAMSTLLRELKVEARYPPRQHSAAFVQA